MPRRFSQNSDVTAAEAAGSPATAGEKKQADVAHVEMGAASKVDGNNADAVWGDMGEDGPNYRNLGWIRASVLEIKTQIGLGVLGLPAVLSTLGYPGGLLVIVTVAGIITWSDYVIGTFKRNHPEVYSLADVGYIFFGKTGREIWGFLYWLMLTAISGAGMLSFGVALNAITTHATCTVAWVVIAAVITGLISSIQTLEKIAWVGWVGLVGIISSVVTLTVAVAVADRPAAAPPGPVNLDIEIVAHTSFVDAINAVSKRHHLHPTCSPPSLDGFGSFLDRSKALNEEMLMAVVVFAYAGTPNFFNIVGEMKDHSHYTKSVITCQTFVTLVYLVIGATVYHYVGQYIASPALGSAGPLMEKICYGLAIPSLIVNAVLNCHMPAKYVFVRLLGKTKHLSKNTKTHYLVWFSCVFVNCALSFIIAEAIPIFNDLLSLIGALLGSFLCIVTEAAMWVHDNKTPERKNWKWAILMFMNVLFIALGIFSLIAGTYGAVVTINDDLHSGVKTEPFSCADSA